MEKINPVEIVKVSRIIPIYKKGEAANAIEVIRVEYMGNELQYDIVSQKGLFEIGEKAIYIQPDYCIPKTTIFNEYHFPGGDEAKCRLGKKGRIRAIKFNFSFKGDSNPIYSYGIILKITSDIQYHINEGEDLMEFFGITKYKSDDSYGSKENQNNGIIDDPFPDLILYKTDESTIQNFKNEIEEIFANNELLSFSVKKDGSSITLYYVDDTENGVCSHERKKKMNRTYIKLYKNDNEVIYKYFNKELNIIGWYNDNTKEFFTDEEASEKFTKVIAKNKDPWVDTVKNYGYDKRFFDYCIKNNIKLAIRGELIGAGNKGGGNKLNSDAKLPKSDIYWFGVDDLSDTFAKRNHYGCEYNLEKVSKDLGLNYAEPILEGVFDYDGIIEECNKIFKKYKKEKGIIIEGIVIRTKFSNNLSVKYINPEYDARS